MPELVDIEGFIVHQTDKAWLFRWDPDKEPIWIPKSVGEIYIGGTNVADIPINGKVEMTLPERWATEKGMI